MDIRVLLIGDDTLARVGLAALLASQPELRVVGQAAADGLEAMLAAARPDVLVWDLGWDPESGLEVMADLTASGLHAVALVPDASFAAEARSAGASGVLLREAGPERLAAAVLAVAHGLVVTDSTLQVPALPSPVPDETGVQEALTPREHDVLGLLAEGLSNKEIGVRLGVSEHTVKFHVNALLRKLGAQSRTEAVVRATRRGLLLL